MLILARLPLHNQPGPPKEPVTLAVHFGKLDKKATYPASIVLDAKAKRRKVGVENSGYRRQKP